MSARLLTQNGSLQAIYDAMKRGVVPGMTPTQRTALKDFEPRWPTVRNLIALRTDVEIPFEEIATERTAPAMVEEASMSDTTEALDAMSGSDSTDRWDDFKSDVAASVAEDRELSGAEATAELRAGMAQARERIANGKSDPNALAVEPRQLTVAAPVDFSQQLEPRNMDDAVTLAQRMFDSRLFSAYGTPQAVLATVLAGRELGIPAMASLRAFHIIEGKPTLSAGAIQSLVVKSGKARYFRCSERTDQRATFVTQRGDDPEMALSYTIEDGRRAFMFTPDMDVKALAEKERKWQASSWGKNPADMCVARAATKLARLVYPDVVSGLYAPEEME
jgi:hypothetical protein